MLSQICGDLVLADPTFPRSPDRLATLPSQCGTGGQQSATLGHELVIAGELFIHADQLVLDAGQYPANTRVLIGH